MQQSQFEVGTLPSNEHAFQNIAFLHPNIYQNFVKLNGGAEPLYIDIKGFILLAGSLNQLEELQIGLSSFQRDMMAISKIDKFEVKVAKIREKNPLNQIHLEIDLVYFDESFKDLNGNLRIEEKDIDAYVKQAYKKKFINKNERFMILLKESKIMIKAQILKIEPIKDEGIKLNYGVIEKQTELVTKVFIKKDQILKLNTIKFQENKIFKQNFNFQELGIGGLDREFQEIFRRAFNSRRYPQNVIEKYGIKHVKGMLLFGPPGTGKTLIARQIAKALDCKEPKIVNGPEVFDKYVGGTEARIRELFKDAEADQKSKGDESQLHIIIFDEIDAICKARGSVGNSGTGVNDTAVNQLLSKLDGVESLNNVLVIGMTNRKDMIDEAILRPGRLEIHLEIGLPDENGRKQIFEIHSRHMRKNNLIDDTVDFDKLARLTKNYTGAEIEAVCRSATSYALFKDIDLNNIQIKDGDKGKTNGQKAASIKSKPPQTSEFVEKKITMYDFDLALNEIKPAFGVDESDLSNSIRGGIVNHGERFNDVFKNCSDFVQEIKTSTTTPLLSILLEGSHGSGKTALAAKFALESKFPFVKIISPESFVGYSEGSKIQQIVKIFEDAYKSPLSLIVLDDIERLIEFIHIGPRFSNPILQTLLVLIKKKPPNSDRKLLIIGTTSLKEILREMEVVDCFNVCMNVPTLKKENEITTVLSKYNISTEVSQKLSQELTQIASTSGIPIKDLMLSIDLSIQKSRQGKIEYDSFMESYNFVTQSSY